MRSPRSAQTKSKTDRAKADSFIDDTNVFINCPFDDGYRPLFRATIFAVYDCGFNPRCALEVYDSGQVRIEKIMRLIECCRYGVHDISRTELDAVNGGKPLPGGLRIAERFAVFCDQLPAIASEFHLDPDELTFKNYANFAAEWLQASLAGSTDPLA